MDASPPAFNSPPTPVDPKPLLAAANGAAEKVAALHVVFLAICAYILVIVFGTTDMDLLIGKGVKLPVVDVDVPIVGFYALAPYLLVLAHFNLLLSLQLLSRKLYAFDEAAQHHDSGELHDQLSIFPYNHYLIGRPSRLMGKFLALVVTITMLLLPLAALLTLQARFLAYQSEAVTWAQRVAIWLDVALVVIFWPVIIERRDSWRAYVLELGRHARSHSLQWLAGVVVCAAVLWLLATHAPEPPQRIYRADVAQRAFWAWLPGYGPAKVIGGLVLLVLVLSILMRCLRHTRLAAYIPGSTAARLNLGAPGLLAILVLGVPLPLILVVDGERIDRPEAIGTRLVAPLRHLDVRERVLLAKPASPETVADLRSTDPVKRDGAQRAIQRIDLQNRSLRRAVFSSVLAPKADLRGAQLQYANFEDAHLRRADLRGAQVWRTQFVGTELHGANLTEMHLAGASFVEVWLDGADLSGAHMRGAVFSEVQFQSARLDRADLEGMNLSETGFRRASLRQAHLRAAILAGVSLDGADLSEAQLDGANLSRASLRGAKLERTHLQGANLERARLQGAGLRAAELHGANLSGAELQGAMMSGADLHGADLSEARLQGVDLSYATFWFSSLRAAGLYTWTTDALGPVDARGLKWRPLDAKDIQALREAQADSAWASKEDQTRYTAAIERAAVPGVRAPKIMVCLRDEQADVTCDEAQPVSEFRQLMLRELGRLACQSPYIARGFLERARRSSSDRGDSPTRGLARHLQSTLSNAGKDEPCPGLTGLAEGEKTLLAELASKDTGPSDESPRGDSGTSVAPKR